MDRTRLPAAALAVLLLLAPAAKGLEAPAPAPQSGEYEQRLADHRRALAKPALRMAGWCFARDLKLSTRRLDELIVRLDPDLPDPHVRLGHRREGTAWKPSGKPLPGVEDKWNPDRWKQYLKVRDEVLAESAALSRAFAGWCEGAGRAKEAQGLWYDVLRYFPADAEARKALGYENLDVSWVATPLRGRAEREAWLDREVRRPALGDSMLLKPLDGVVPTGWQTAPGNRLSQAASALFVVDTTYGKTEALDFLRASHAAREVVRRLGLATEKAFRETKPWGFVILNSKEDYENMARWATEKDPRKRAQYLALSGFYPSDREFLKYSAKPEDVRSTLVHKVAEHLAVASWTTESPAWYSEGTACMAIDALAESGTCRCIGDSTSSVESDSLDDSAAWGSLLVDGISRGKDQELETLLRMELNDMDGVALLQSWSLLWWMREVDPARLQAFVARYIESKNAETASLNSFGCPAVALERAWKDWIRNQWLGAGGRK